MGGREHCHQSGFHLAADMARGGAGTSLAMVGYIRALNAKRELAMRFNPPPNWPKPPEGWVPPPGWSPDPSWPPPPPGWKLWVDDAPVVPDSRPAPRRPARTGDDVEYFGDDRAWSADVEQSFAQVPGGAGPVAPPAQPTEVAPHELSAHHLGCRATVRWDDERRYDIGTIVAVSADSAEISVRLAGLEAPISFQREGPSRGPANPRLYVWI
ncbi:hypothetical protein [Mycobacterium sp. SM1]|uniref:hypothetical protein n=1 Tax=Mycobacterium sp. SM1 TaxID=2816243 RepID=UPI001F1F2611|nr:hypothetical protein [Mycobacterium sp. SM1]